LEQIGVRYRLLDIDVPEQHAPGEAPEEYVLRLALAKARAGRALLAPGQGRVPVLGADTAVVLDGAILGKPAGRDEALDMLARLSGRSHQVLSAVALAGATEAARLSVSLVSFRDTQPAEREAYWASGEPADKAGGYAVQGRGAVFIARLEGSYSGVMGLPLFETAALLAEFGIDIL